MDKLLLHTCCGPCLMDPGQILAQDYEVASFYFNPNIHSQTEHDKRLVNAKKAAQFLKIDFISTSFSPKEYFNFLNKNFQETFNKFDKQGIGEKIERCYFCYKLRLQETALMAKKLGFRVFSTTLLVSPYQKTKLILEIGSELSERNGIKFVGEDFKNGYKKGREEAAKINLYRQNFCGCAYSFVEKFRRNK